MNEQEVLYTMALTRMTGFNFQTALQLYRELGGGRAVYEHRLDIRDVCPECSERLTRSLQDWSLALARAEEELAFMEKHHIRALCLGDADYPQRLAETPDAPIILFFELCPEILIVSGLAYGVDICAHRAALSNGYDTVGVLAHGLDDLYPSCHRDTAKEMLQQGGLLTEYMTHTQPDKRNFVKRNRIVAGMTDATILVESAAKGGGLITCGIAQSYDRAVFAFPGAVGSTYSEGCNNLIRDNGAGLIANADDFVTAMGWQTDMARIKAESDGIERNLFPELSEEEQKIVNLLDEMGDLQQNILSVRTDIPIGRLIAVLFELEMKGVIRPLAGGAYHLLK